MNGSRERGPRPHIPALDERILRLDGAKFEHFGWMGLKTHIVWQEAPKEGDERLYIEVFARVGALTDREPQ